MTSQQAVDFVKKGKNKLLEPRSQSPPKALGVKKQNSSGSKPAGMGRTVGKSPMKRKQTLQVVRE